MYDALSEDEVNIIITNMNNKEELLTIINEIAKDRYELGYDNAFESWCGYDEETEEK